MTQVQIWDQIAVNGQGLANVRVTVSPVYQALAVYIPTGQYILGDLSQSVQTDGTGYWTCNVVPTDLVAPLALYVYLVEPEVESGVPPYLCKPLSTGVPVGGWKTTDILIQPLPPGGSTLAGSVVTSLAANGGAPHIGSINLKDGTKFHITDNGDGSFSFAYTGVDGVSSVTGTPNQVATAPTAGAVVVSLPNNGTLPSSGPGQGWSAPNQLTIDGVLVTAYAGNPNTHVTSANAGDLVLDTATPTLWQATAAGVNNAWIQTGGGGGATPKAVIDGGYFTAVRRFS